MSKKVKYKSLLSPGETVLIAIFFLAVLSLFYFTFFTPNYYNLSSPVKFEVKKGESFSQIANRLYDANIISGKLNFKIAGILYGTQKKIKPARYYIPNGLSYLGLIEYFIDGKADYLKMVKLFDGSTSKSIASRLRSELYVDSVAFIKELKNKKLLDSLSIDETSFEGYLLPQEYDLYERSSPREIIITIYNGWKKFICDSLKKSIVQTHRSIHDILTIASIVNGETNKKDEMTKIAGVYYNRLKIGMKLQADPTIQYLQPNGSKRLSFDDLRNNSPYNTYKYFGLPPGPIDNPGKNAIIASVYPDKHNYLYFVADGKGGHKFARTFTEHLKNVQLYKDNLRSSSK
ncbi:MAG: endolytic transglycosylase MltG [Ignavibacteriaceae bacterium]|nr:endolytic transglycosylase MltG [Ignavibacteriaceae bacterium]